MLRTPTVIRLRTIKNPQTTDSIDPMIHEKAKISTTAPKPAVIIVMMVSTHPDVATASGMIGQKGLISRRPTSEITEPELARVRWIDWFGVHFL